MVGLCGLGRCKGLDEALLSKALALGLLMGDEDGGAEDGAVKAEWEAIGAAVAAAMDVMIGASASESSSLLLLLLLAWSLVRPDRDGGESPPFCASWSPETRPLRSPFTGSDDET